jgi:hypothetical protein
MATFQITIRTIITLSLSKDLLICDLISDPLRAVISMSLIIVRITVTSMFRGRTITARVTILHRTITRYLARNSSRVK